MIDELRAALDALNGGDPTPFAALIAGDSEWRGVSEGHLWWKHRPSCHGPSEALGVMKNGIQNRGKSLLAINPEFEQIDENTIIGPGTVIVGDGREEVLHGLRLLHAVDLGQLLHDRDLHGRLSSPSEQSRKRSPYRHATGSSTG